MYSWEQRKKVYNLLANLFREGFNKIRIKKINAFQKMFNFTLQYTTLIFNIRHCNWCGKVIGIVKQCKFGPEDCAVGWIDIFGQEDYYFCPDCK